MAIYIVNRDTDINNNHEVHRLYACDHLPDEKNRRRVGDFDNCQDAVEAAKKLYSKVDGCWWCSRSCHKGR